MDQINRFLEIVIPILFVMFLGGLNSLLSFFLDYCFWEGSIFSNYLPWLAKWNLKQFKPEIFHALETQRINKNPEYENNLIKSASNHFFFKILGGCVICSNIWLGAITFTIFALVFGLSFWLAFPYLLFSSFILRKIA